MSNRPDLKEFGVHPLAAYRRRMIMATEGMEATGKTNLIKSMPKPIFLLDLDWNTEGVLDDLISTKLIDVLTIRMDPTLKDPNKIMEVDGAKARRIKKAWHAACASGYYKSGAVDNGSFLFELFVRAEFGRNDKIPPLKKKLPNEHMRYMFQQAKSAGMNMLMTHQMKDEYKKKEGDDSDSSGEKTGRKVRKGWNDDHLNYQCQVMGRHFKKPGVSGLKKFGFEFLKCTANTNLEGEKIYGEEINWVDIGQAVFPLSTEDEWR